MAFEPYVVSGTDKCLISTYGGHVLSDFVSSASIDISTYKAYGASTFSVTSQDAGLCEVSLPVEFCDELTPRVMADSSLRLISPNTPRSRIEANMAAFERKISNGTFTLNVGDGYLYLVALSGIGASWIGEYACQKVYTLIGMKQKAEVTLAFAQTQSSEVGRTVWFYKDGLLYKRICGCKRMKLECESTVQRTVCGITITAGFDSSTTREFIVAVNDIAFCLTITGGKTYVIQSPAITEDGTAITNSIYWYDFPYFVPGENVVDVACSLMTDISIEISYTPTFL